MMTRNDADAAKRSYGSFISRSSTTGSRMISSAVGFARFGNFQSLISRSPGAWLVVCTTTFLGAPLGWGQQGDGFRTSPQLRSTE